MVITAHGFTRPTIRDVAAEANVSTSTVSLYIQQDPRVAQETGARIAAAIVSHSAESGPGADAPRR